MLQVAAAQKLNNLYNLLKAIRSTLTDVYMKKKKYEEIECD